MSDTKLGRLGRLLWEWWGHIDTASGLPSWFTWAKTVTASIAGFVTVWRANAEEIPSAYGIPAALLAFGAVLWLWNQFYARRLQREAATVRALNEETKAHDREDSQAAGGTVDAWIHAIADADDSDVANRIHLISSEIREHLSAPQPYADLEFRFVNATVFSLAFARVEGHIRLQGHPLDRMPELAQERAVLGHGNHTNFVLRQWVSRDVVNRIQELGKVNLETGHFAVWFSYDYKGARKEARKAFPDTLFSVGATNAPAVALGTQLFPGSVTQSPAPPPIYVGRIEPNVQSLSTEHWMELSLTVFNGTGCELVIDETPRGSLICDDQPLQIPASISERSSGSSREIQLSIRQYLQATQAQDIKDRIDTGKVVPMMFDNLRIPCVVKWHDRPHEEIDIPLPDGINVHHGIKCGRIVVARLSAGKLTITGS